MPVVVWVVVSVVDWPLSVGELFVRVELGGGALFCWMAVVTSCGGGVLVLGGCVTVTVTPEAGTAKVTAPVPAFTDSVPPEPLRVLVKVIGRFEATMLEGASTVAAPKLVAWPKLRLPLRATAPNM